MSVKFIRIIFLASFLLNSVALSAAEKSILPIKRWVTASGTPVLFVQEKELPMIDIQIVYNAGSSSDEKKPGIAKITNEALSSGTRKKTADEVAALFDDVGAKYSNAVNRDMAIVALRSLSDPKFFQPAFNNFLDVLTTPTFPDAEFKRIQQQTLIVLNEQEESPGSIAAKAFYRTVFDNHPYGHPISGDKTTIKKLSAEDLRRFYRKWYTAQNSLITIVGDINESKAKEIAGILSKQMPSGQKVAPSTVQPYQPTQRAVEINFPSSQTHVMIGQAAINRNDPAYFPLMVGNYVLGGGSLTSRLFEEVREKRGLVYTVRSQFHALKDRGPFIVELQTRNVETPNAIQIVNETLNKFVKDGPSAVELTAAKKNLTQGFILRLASNAAIISQLINIGYYQLPLNYLDTYQSNISRVSNTDIQKAFQKYIHPENLVTITVGNGKRLNGQTGSSS